MIGIGRRARVAAALLFVCGFVTACAQGGGAQAPQETSTQAVDGDAPLGDEAVGLATRTVARLADVLVESHGARNQRGGRKGGESYAPRP